MRVRFKYKTMLINDDWTGERLYELQVNFMGLIWITVRNGSIENEFKKSELEDVKRKLELKEYCIKNFKLHVYDDIENEFNI